MPIRANRFRSLQQMLQLIELDIRIRIVDKRVQKLERLKNAHLSVIEPQELGSLPLDEVERLLAMILPIKLADRLAGRLIVIAIIFPRLRARLRVHLLLQKLLPRMKPILLTRIGSRRIVHRSARDSTWVTSELVIMREHAT